MDLLAYAFLATLAGCLLLGGLASLGGSDPSLTLSETCWRLRWPLAALPAAVLATAGLSWLAWR